MWIVGFLGTRATVMLDLLFLAQFIVVPAMFYGISRAKKQQYGDHKKVMLALVTTIALLVLVYSHGYMAHDKGYVRFFTYLALFSSSMLGLIVSPNLLEIYVFWELVGMCSYLLVGFCHLGNQLCFRTIFLIGTDHDRGAMRVISAKVNAAVAPQFLETHPDIRLDILDKMS